MEVKFFDDVDEYHSLLINQGYFNPADLQAKHALFFAVLLRELNIRLPKRTFCAAFDGGSVVGAAMLTPPHTKALLVSEKVDAARSLGAAWKHGETPVPVDGVNASNANSKAFMEGYGARDAELFMSMTMYELKRDQALALDVAEGWGQQCSSETQHAQYLRLMAQFHKELHLTADHEHTERMWANGEVYGPAEGRPFDTLCVVTGRTDSTARVGGVYTEPANRGRGLASKMVRYACRDVCRRQPSLSTLFLFADNANSVSTGLYMKMGFKKCSVMESWKWTKIK